VSERVREHRGDPPDAEEVRSRAEEGWRLVAVEWERAGSGSAAEEEESPPAAHEVPYGQRVCGGQELFLEDHPDEQRTLRLILAGLVDDRPLSAIARDLNERGLRTRRGESWTQSGLFDLLPRIVEAGARILRSEAWAEERRQSRLRAI